MSYEAIIAILTNVRPHPDADKLQLAVASGFQIIVGLDQKEGDIGVFFPSDGRLSDKMLMENKLFRKNPSTGEPMGGFFEENGRVRTIKLRGVKSEGFWIPSSALLWTGADIEKLTPGTQITELNGQLICEKYMSPATRSAQAAGSGMRARRMRDFPHFKQQFNVSKLRYCLNTLPLGAVIYITEKCHGTSGRTAHVQEILQPRWWQSCLNKLPFCKWPERKVWTVVSGSRRVILAGKKPQDGYYKGKFRQEINRYFEDYGIHRGETVFYEIVGWDGDKPIMPMHPIPKEHGKQLVEQYAPLAASPHMLYTYGCVPRGHKVLIYRITHTNPDGHVVELPWWRVKTRALELGLCTVPDVVGPFVLGSTDCAGTAELYEKCLTLAEGQSLLDPGHIKEGVCIRVEHPAMFDIFKFKAWWFCELEGICKNSPDYLDVEDIS